MAGKRKYGRLAGIVLLALSAFAATPSPCPESLWEGPLLEAARLQGANRHREAEAAYRRVLRLVEPCGPRSVALGLALNNFAAFEHSRGRLREAERLYLRSRAVLEPLLSQEDPLLTRVTSNLAHVYLDSRRYGKARQLLRETLAGKNLNAKDPDLAVMWLTLAHVYGREESYAEAEEIYRRQIPVLIEAGDAFRESAAGAYTELANLLMAAGRPREALAAAEEAQALLDRGTVFYVTGLVRTLNLRGAILMKSKHEADAIPLLERAIRALDGASLAIHPLAPDLLLNYATCLQRVGRKAEARLMQKEAAARLEQLKEDYPAAETVEYSELVREAHR